MSSEKPILLNRSERALLLSFFFFSLASPIFLLFINTFLWRESSSPFTLIIYNIGIYLGLSFGFIANRTLLLRVSARALYAISCILQGIIPILLVTLAPTATLNLVGLGICFGISSGLFFANRNFFTSLLTKNKSRFTFLSLDQSLGILAGIITPLIIGWYITFALNHQHLSTFAAYGNTTVLGLCFLVISAITLHIPHVEQRQTTKHLFVREASTLWKKVRAMDFVGGLVHGVYMTIPLIVALMLLSGESSLGKMKSAAALIGGLSIYLLGKYKTKIPHGWLMVIWVIGSAIAGAIIAISFSAGSVIAAALVMGIVGPLQSTSTAHAMYSAVEKENANERANFLLDREIFLNVGRVSALLLCACALFYAPNFTLRYGYLAATVLHIVQTFLVFRVKRSLQ